MMKKCLSGMTAIIAVFFCLATPAESVNDYESALFYWQRVLDQFVDEEGRIDFTGLAKNREDLRRYVAYIGKISPETEPDLFPTREHVLTYHINTYNALALHGIIEENISDGFTSFFKRAVFFKFHSIVIAGEKTSLYDYEKKIIRPLGEPRVHFALNCMVKDCPRLPRVPFHADTLQQQLESATLEFFSKDKHLRVDNGKKQLWLSTIMKMYKEDFTGNGKNRNLIQYVNQYLEKAVPEDYQLRFIRYDWRLNYQPD